MYVRSEYLHCVYRPDELADLAARVSAVVKKIKVDALVVTGVSGMAMGFPVSMLTHVPLINVRKGCSAHCRYTVEGAVQFMGALKVAILDDFICTGETLTRMVTALEDDGCFTDVNFTHVICYNQKAGKDSEYLARKQETARSAHERLAHVELICVN